MSIDNIFINLSNHNSTKWNDRQLQAVQDCFSDSKASIVNIPFPAIPAMASSNEVKAMARKTATDILNNYTGKTLVIHVMGEACFVHNFLKYMENNKDIRLIHSTTERISKEIDGVKTSIFQFHSFRDY